MTLGSNRCVQLDVSHMVLFYCPLAFGLSHQADTRQALDGDLHD